MLRRRTPLEKRLGYRFREPSLLETALTHRSYAHEKDTGANYERLEFLGDSVLGLVAGEWLFHRHPDLPEGELSKRKAHLVSRPVLARHASSLGLGEEIRLGVGEERSGGRTKASLLADVWEAILGAVYLDGGLEPAARLVLPLLEDGTERRGPYDAKTHLQEVLQGQGRNLPEYVLAEETGPDHAKRFTVECRIRGEVAGVGEGRSKKKAEQAAASAALERVEGGADAV